MNTFARLLGLNVTAMFVSAEAQSAMRFDTGYNGREKIYIGTYSDCCSETWFADLIGVGNLLGQIVTGVEILELPPPQDERSRQESDEAYGVRLKTALGHCDVIYRNSSNGYYGGSAEDMRDEEGQALDWLEIKGDWQA